MSAILRRLHTRPAPTTQNTPAAPLWVRALTAIGRPIVLAVALLMCAPGEYHLARHAGWADPYAAGMCIVLSAYAGIAAAVASTRRAGDRGRWSAIIGAILALVLAMAAQVVSHLIGTGHLEGDQPWLIGTVSIVPPAVVGHLLHLAATPPSRHRAPEDAADTAIVPAQADASAPSPIRWVTIPAGTALLPIVPLDADAEDAQDTERRDASGRRLISTRELADRVGVSPSTIRNWIASGQLTPAETDARGHHWFDPTVAVGAALS